MRKTPQLEISTDMRKMTEQSLEQVKNAIHGYLRFIKRAVPGNVGGGPELTNKILGYAERNVASVFEFAQRLVQAKDVNELANLQMEFIKAQMQAMTEQARDLSNTAMNTLTEGAKNLDKR
jgi:hypothetical protein